MTEFKVWRDVKLPAGNILIPGVVSQATDLVEHPVLVADHLIAFAEVVGQENVIAGTDCGFAQQPFYQRVHPTIQWAKLEALVAGARLASKELWAKSRKKSAVKKSAVKKSASKKAAKRRVTKTAARRRRAA